MYLIIKRIFDLVFSVLAIIITFPILSIIILLQIILNKFEIFYVQERVGLNQHRLNIIKFATMHRNAINMPGGGNTIRNDPRITLTGHFLRFTKLNELPQIINVLIGDMSFVGPRPYLRIGFDLFTKEAQNVLEHTKPGITGISSIVFRDEEHYVTYCCMDRVEYYKEYIFPYKSKLEIWYSKNQSLLTDILIIFLTVYKILFPKSKLEFKVFKTLPRDSNFN